MAAKPTSLMQIAKRVFEPLLAHFKPENTTQIQLIPIRGTHSPLGAEDAVSPPVLKSPKPFQEALYEHWNDVGREAARSTATPKPETHILTLLKEQAEDSVPLAIPPPFDAERFQIDKRTQSKLDRIDGEREECETDCHLALAELRLREDAFAKHPEPTPRPAVSPAFGWAATGAIAWSVAPVFHDWLAGPIFPVLKWAIAIGSGGLIGLLIVTAILPDESDEGASDPGGAVGGVVIGAGFLLARLSMAGGGRDVLIALGSAALEIGAVLFLDLRAKRLGAQIATWTAERRARSQAQQLLGAAQAELSRVRERLADVDRQIQRIETEDLKGRVWGSDPKALSRMAVTAVKSAYALEAARNRSRGIAPKEIA